AIGDGGNNNLLPFSQVLQLPFALDLNAARALLVNLAESRAVGNNLPTQGKVGTFNAVKELRRGRFGLIDQVNRRFDDFSEVVRRDVRRYADGDAGGAVDQQVRELRGQDDRLLLGAVEVGPQVHGVPAQLGHEALG